MKKEEFIVISVLLFVLTLGLFKYTVKEKAEIKRGVISSKENNLTASSELEYIEKVIIYGSNRLGYQKEGMEGGFVPKDKAEDVACYVYELSGKKCKHSYAKDAGLYFSSNCAGCHGKDGKGLNGAFPDLTRYPLEGFANSLN